MEFRLDSPLSKLVAFVAVLIAIVWILKQRQVEATWPRVPGQVTDVTSDALLHRVLDRNGPKRLCPWVTFTYQVDGIDHSVTRRYPFEDCSDYGGDAVTGRRTRDVIVAYNPKDPGEAKIDRVAASSR